MLSLPLTAIIMLKYVNNAYVKFLFLMLNSLNQKRFLNMFSITISSEFRLQMMRMMLKMMKVCLIKILEAKKA